jgi:hypothetical protein
MRKAIYAALSEAKIEVPVPRLIVSQPNS